jgi:ketosteroid isomerase-like protein
MTTRELADRLAREWVGAWNAHDLDAVLAHYHEDVVFSSPFVAELRGGDGTLHGRDELREYFERALRTFPDLVFTDLRVTVGATSVCLIYRSVRGLLAAETMILDDDGRARQVYAHYASDESGAGNG